MGLDIYWMYGIRKGETLEDYEYYNFNYKSFEESPDTYCVVPTREIAHILCEKYKLGDDCKVVALKVHNDYDGMVGVYDPAKGDDEFGSDEAPDSDDEEDYDDSDLEDSDYDSENPLVEQQPEDGNFDEIEASIIYDPEADDFAAQTESDFLEEVQGVLESNLQEMMNMESFINSFYDCLIAVDHTSMAIDLDKLASFVQGAVPLQDITTNETSEIQNVFIAYNDHVMPIIGELPEGVVIKEESNE